MIAKSRTDEAKKILFSAAKRNGKDIKEEDIVLKVQGVPKKHGNSVTNCISYLLGISNVIPNFKSNNIIMSARVYFMKRVKDCKDVSTMSPQDEQCIVHCNFLVLLSTPLCGQNINRRNVNIADETLANYIFLSRYHCTII